jgi:NADH:ubiquinone oxidoreductase subunit F (NADH-binding)
MDTKDIITKLKKDKLLGRGGAAFPTGLKWEMVKSAKAKKKYIICNASEGEPNVFKDGFILKNYPEEVIEGVKIALETIDNSSAYIYLRKDYYAKFKKNLEKLIGNLPIKLFKKTGGYLAGEETSIFEAIEGKRPEPRIKPPFPPQAGLFDCPTLINNLETFYQVAKIAKNQYQKTRFYSISGEVKNEGVYQLSEDWSISQILKETKNWPDFDFFVQSGGGASGEILLSDELNQPARGQGAIVVFNRKKTNPFSLMKKWIDFFLEANCDKCVPCREGVYRMAEMLKKEKIDKEILSDLFFVLEETSFCALGKGVVVPFRSLINKLLDGQK